MRFKVIIKQVSCKGYFRTFLVFLKWGAEHQPSLHELRGDITPSAYADYAVKWAASGAGIIGGCCGISPDHLHEVKTRLIG